MFQDWRTILLMVFVLVFIDFTEKMKSSGFSESFQGISRQGSAFLFLQ